MTIYFTTPGELDLKAAFTFGISAKENDSPIGFFGTGLKYAVATLLRTGHKISITIRGEEHLFTYSTMETRGQNFKVVCLDGEPLGFTTALGKNWEPWMCFRELHSNTLDENGSTTKALPVMLEPCTVIRVEGDGIDKAYAERDSIFCSSMVLASNDELEVRYGPSDQMFYRGVRAGKTRKTGSFTYNILSDCVLTEDRTFANPFSVEMKLYSLVARLDNVSVLKEILTAESGTLEGLLDFDYTNHTSEAFNTAVKELSNDQNLNKSARRLAIRNSLFMEEELEFDSIEKQQLERAIDFLGQIGYTVTQYKIVKMDLQGALGQAKQGTIYISPNAFRMGTKYVAGTLYEEFLHLSEGLDDETRNMQNALIDTIMSMGEKLRGEPL